jgi:signal transduction histidine kinase
MNIQKAVHRRTGLLRMFLSTLIKLLVLLIGRKVLLHKREKERVNVLARYEVQRRMSEFLTVAGHELKTPLTSIKGNIQLTTRRLRRLRGSLDTEAESSGEIAQALVEVRQLLESTDQQITRLTRLVNTLLESSRIQANAMELLFEVCELSQLIYEIIQDTLYVPEERTIRVTIPQNSAVFVLADSNRIKQVIVHYLSNAHKYSQLDRPIEIILREEGQTACLSVRDEGPGIPVSEHKRIWERFYRVPGIEIQNGSGVGLGLGLHTCRAIIELHHGQVGVYSTPGTGATFWFTLPLLRQELSGV